MAWKTLHGVAVNLERLPVHVGVIMDGNGRWAQARGLERIEGHRAGSKSVRAVVRTCRRLGVRVLTLYTFSTQNWCRPQAEVEALMELLGEFAVKELPELNRRGIRVVHLGEARRMPAEIRRRLRALQAATRHNRGMVLALALSYGAREEITRAARSLCRKVAKGQLDWRSVDVAGLAAQLYTRRLPDPDLIIRTSGELRVSNFLLWQAAYAEFHFSQKLWPDFGPRDLLEAIADFQSRHRRFGLTSQQLLSQSDQELEP